ncbi:MAG: type II toxin-antitoxin system VapC family toxin [Rhodospirillaceae bacterium]|nr:type II toxin-antitoxin system VapC family toxin [Rhodospirillaceae bacterium]
MPIVIDCSVAANWCLPDEDEEVAGHALALVSVDGMLVPPLFWYELRNVLIVGERRQRIEAADVAAALRLVAALPTRVEPAHDETLLLGLARSYLLSVYDAAYLELAKRTRSPLATLDRTLRRAAAAEAVEVVT